MQFVEQYLSVKAVKSVSVTQTTVSGDMSCFLYTGTSPTEPSPVTPLVAETGVKSKKGLKTPTSSIRRSARLRVMSLSIFLFFSFYFLEKEVTFKIVTEHSAPVTFDHISLV
jgi:hypothetical protein